MPLSRLIRRILPPLTALLIFIAVWELSVRLLQISAIVVPPPSAVVTAGIRMAPRLVPATIRTALAAAAGLTAAVIGGAGLAFLFSQFRLLREALYPYSIMLQTVPIVALAPIVVIALGRGFHSVSLVAFVISIFPIIANTTTGLMQTDRDLQDLFRLHQATRSQTFFRLTLPSALPYLISGIRIASGSAVIGAIVGEFFVGSSQPGLGALIQAKYSSVRIDELYAVVACAVLLGITAFGTSGLIDRRRNT